MDRLEREGIADNNLKHDSQCPAFVQQHVQVTTNLMGVYSPISKYVQFTPFLLPSYYFPNSNDVLLIKTFNANFISC